MDTTVAAAFVALGLCIPLIGIAFAMRMVRLFNLFDRRGPGDKRRKPPPPLGGNPYHLP
jgi:hypothetical protein